MLKLPTTRTELARSRGPLNGKPTTTAGVPPPSRPSDRHSALLLRAKRLPHELREAPAEQIGYVDMSPTVGIYDNVLNEYCAVFSSPVLTP